MAGYQTTNRVQPEEEFLRTSGPGKIQLPDGRWVMSSSILGREEVQRQQDLQTKSEQNQMIREMADRGDPFSSQRGQYQGQLRDLMANGGANAMDNPFFKANAEAGQEAASRRLAQMGMSKSGNAAFELQRNAMANQGDAYFKLADLLSGLSGGKADPAGGASAALGAMGMFENRRKYDTDRHDKLFPRAVISTGGGGYSGGGGYGSGGGSLAAYSGGGSQSSGGGSQSSGGGQSNYLSAEERANAGYSSNVESVSRDGVITVRH